MCRVSEVGVKDFESAGLLDGLEGGEREARLGLLRELAGEGFSMDELKAAAAEDRLGLLPVDRLLAGETKYAARDIERLSGLPLDFLFAVRQAIGLALPDPDERAFGDADLEAACLFKRLRDAGLPDEGLLEVTRVLGSGLAQGAEAMRMLVARWLLPQGVDERELSGLTLAAARELLPMTTPLLQYTLTAHMRDQVRNQQYGLLELAEEASTSTRGVFVAFTDMVGYTRLGERIEIVELGRLVGRLGSLARESVRPPTRIVKTIGDAIMFVSPAPEPLLDTMLGLTEHVEAEREELPPIRSGLAAGVALSRDGDWYGPPVNLASRITDIARAGSVLATQDLHDAAPDRYAWSYAGEHRLRGFRRPVALYRVRREPSA
jgi:adenylate cyclase